MQDLAFCFFTIQLVGRIIYIIFTYSQMNLQKPLQYYLICSFCVNYFFVDLTKPPSPTVLINTEELSYSLLLIVFEQFLGLVVLLVQGFILGLNIS